MELEAFGQTLEINLNQKNIIVISGILGFVIMISIAIFFIMPKIQNISQNKDEIRKLENDVRVAKAKYQSEKKKVDKLVSIYEKQKENLTILEEKFDRASLKDILELKISIQKMIDNLKLNVISVGGTQREEVKKEGYIKEYVPYEVDARFYQIARLFYYLENSKDWLLTFGDTGFVMKAKGDEGVLNLKFKIGAYIEEGDNR
ncbi:MAG: hypothetical protein ACQERZ_01685 [Fusobacteriota bacterium]